VTVGTPPPPCNAAFLAIQDSVNNHLYHFFASYPNAAGPFHWSFGDGTFGNGPFAHHVYQNPGYYVVCLQVISPNGQITCSECDTIQVTGNPVPTYHIWGHVFAGANTLLDKGKVRLFRLSLTNVGAQLVATTPVDSAGAYHFYNVPAGAYYIKAKPGPMSQFYGQFLPTYYPHNVFWANATPVVIPQVNNPYNINLKPAQAPVPGPGTIGGMITQAYKFSGSGAPASDVEILLKPTSGDPFIVAESNANGEFIFNDLDYGTYEVYPEVTGLVTIPATITLNANNPSATNINMVISPNQVATGMSDDMENMKMFGVYPNPASSLITMELATELPVDAVLSITDLTGRLVYTENITLSSGKQKFTYDLASFENGTYLLQIRTDQGTVNYRKFSVIK
jgi:PKD repeat protein